MPTYYDIWTVEDKMRKAGATEREILVLHTPCVSNGTLYTFEREPYGIEDEEEPLLQGEYGTREDLTREEVLLGLKKLFSVFPKKKSIEVLISW